MKKYWDRCCIYQIEMNNEWNISFHQNSLISIPVSFSLDHKSWILRKSYEFLYLVSIILLLLDSLFFFFFFFFFFFWTCLIYLSSLSSLGRIDITSLVYTHSFIQLWTSFTPTSQAKLWASPFQHWWKIWPHNFN